MHASETSRNERTWRSSAYTLSRNNLEFAGVVVYFFTLAVIFAITIIVMMCRTGNGSDERAQIHQSETMAGLADRV